MSVVVCFKHKTAYEMRISDWSSDVCSSDLQAGVLDPVAQQPLVAIEHLALPQRAAEILELERLPLHGHAADAADDLGKPVVAAAALREHQVAVERAIGDRPGAQARVDLVELLDRKSTRLNSSH